MRCCPIHNKVLLAQQAIQTCNCHNARCIKGETKFCTWKCVVYMTPPLKFSYQAFTALWLYHTGFRKLEASLIIVISYNTDSRLVLSPIACGYWEVTPTSIN
jgi:hypothetical protein